MNNTVDNEGGVTYLNQSGDHRGQDLFDKEKGQTVVEVAPTSCRERISKQLWSSGPLNYQEKSTNHVRANTLVSDRTLFIVRALFFCLQTSFFIYNATNWRYPAIYKYFTIWGMTLTTIYFLIVMIGYLCEYCNKGERGIDPKPYSPFRMWKWVTFTFQAALTWETVITIVYWALLWPTEDHSDGAWHDFIRTSIGHLWPFVYLMIDFVLNRYYFEWKQIWLILITVIIYGGVNITVTKTTGIPVYSVLAWDSVGSWMLGAVLIPFTIGVSIGYYYLSKWKFDKLKMTANNVLYKSIAVSGSRKSNQSSPR